MDLQIIPVDMETGERYTLDPDVLKNIDNDDLSNLLADLKRLDKLKKEAEKEVKVRLDEGQKFTRLSYGHPQVMKVLTSDDDLKKTLIEKYGLESVEPLSVSKLEKKYGEKIYEDIEPYIIEKPKAQAIQWDR